VQDAATLYSIIKWLRAMTHHLRHTTLISLLQPPPETFALFDDVMLMAEGTLLYHGPANKAVEHMSSFGFHLPPRKDVPSWLQVQP
jgi:ABC-type multidrug transport system ATPase subunit